MARLTHQELANKYRPLLVLYPEIKPGTRRRINRQFPDKAPLVYDYHPRSIRFILENAAIHGSDEPGNFDEILSHMDKNRTSNLDIVVGAGPKDRTKFWKRYAEFLDKNKDNKEYDLRGYAHIYEGEDYYASLLAITYWYAYLFNDFKNTHEMDWESVTVVLEMGSDGSETPIACSCSAHHAGFRRQWEDIEKANDTGRRSSKGSHPVIYVANGSHANYFFGGLCYGVTAEKFGLRVDTSKLPVKEWIYYDYVTSFRRGSKRLVDIEVIPPKPWKDKWGWLNFEGKWGSPHRICSPPNSIVGRNIWNDPFEWIDYYCEDIPDTCWLERSRSSKSP